MSKKGRVLVAMSGGIDSSVAAVLLHEQGYEVIGMTMKTWDYASAGGSKKETGCCSLDSINDARAIAVEKGFPHYIIDIREEFGDHVIDNFVNEYLAGRTPNPCVMCNTHIKWEALLKRADKLDCEFIATGHYANVRKETAPHPPEGGHARHSDERFGYETADPVTYELVKEFALKNRSVPTEAENMYWQLVSGKKLEGFKFRRQHIIGSYIADFVCLKEKLVIEIDGLIHQLPENQHSDEVRTNWLNGQGFRVLRLSNEEVLSNPDGVVSKTLNELHLPPSGGGGARLVVSKGLDDNKDQSYVLWGVSQECLSRTMFPVGKFTKPAIRQMALDMGFTDLANKSESYEICFIPDNDYRGFLKRRVEGIEAKLDGGLFVNKKGEIIGKHRGYPFYTIGQRKGLEVAVGEPLFVTEIIPQSNTVVLGAFDDLKKQEMWVRDVNFIKYASLNQPIEAVTRIHYKDPGTHSTIERVGDKVKVTFHKPVSAVTPGQSAVFYDGDDVIGGGFIS